MRLIRSFLTIICTLLIFSWQAHGLIQSDQSFRDQPTIDRIEMEIRKELRRSQGPGISISIIHKGHEVLNSGYGFANTEDNLPVTPQTLFKSASTSKVLVALAILVLEQQGRVKLTSPLSDYLPDIHQSLSELTLRQLLTHTAGLKDLVNDFGPPGVSRQIDYANELNKDIFLTSPGEVLSYSNSGYNIVGAVIESIMQTDFDSAMKSLIFDKFGMHSTTYRNDKVNRKKLAYGHSITGSGASMSAQLPDNARERASGMMLTTASEMNKVLGWLVSDHPESDKALKDKLLTIIADKRMTGSYFQYGFGLFHSEYCGFGSIWHTGGMPGYSAAFLAVPSESLSIVILGNGEDINRWNILSVIMQHLLSADCTPSPGSGELTTFTHNEILELTGTYDQGFGRRIELSTAENGLVMIQGSQKFPVRKNTRGQLVTLVDGKPRTAYGIYRDSKQKVKYLQYWVRAFPKLD